jgi:hypothetical protein
MLLAVAQTSDSTAGMKFILKLVVRRVVVGNLGTGNVERRFGEAARKVYVEKDWRILSRDLVDLNPSVEEFKERLSRRSFNKTTLAFLRRSIVERTMTPGDGGYIEQVWSRLGGNWPSMTEEEGSYWASTIGNSYLAAHSSENRPAESWYDFKTRLLPKGIDGEFKSDLSFMTLWNASSIANMGKRLAEEAAKIWY